MESAGMICRSVFNASYWDRRRLCNGVGGHDRAGSAARDVKNVDGWLNKGHLKSQLLGECWRVISIISSEREA